jgi:tetratricopeptide (TPR) repeat protein
MKENANDYINAGGYYFDLKDYKMAHKYFSAYANFPKTDALKDANIQADPNYKMIPFYASMAALNPEDPQMAIDALETAKSVDYEKYRVHYFLTEAYKKGGNKEKYIEATKEAFTAFPDSIYFLANLVNHYITNKDYDNAISFLKTGLSKKNDLNLMVALSEVLIEAKRPDEETKEILQKAMQLYPNAAQPYYYSGHLLLKKAMEMTNKANEIKINKKYQEAIQAIKPIYAEALPLFLKASELTENKNIEYMKPIRSIYYNLGKDKEFKQYDALIQALEKK